MAHPFVHCELNATDVAAAKKFYGSLFGWELKDENMPTGPYTMIGVGDDGTGGGIMKQMIPGAPSSWVPYVLVSEIEADTKRAEALGASVMVPVTDIGMGKLSILCDPTGAPVGLWQASSPG
jgi:predicted enzyme related to lactoylglutathione lyase